MGFGHAPWVVRMSIRTSLATIKWGPPKAFIPLFAKNGAGRESGFNDNVLGKVRRRMFSHGILSTLTLSCYIYLFKRSLGEFSKGLLENMSCHISTKPTCLQDTPRRDEQNVAQRIFNSKDLRI